MILYLGYITWCWKKASITPVCLLYTSIDCISAIGTLENIQYEKQTENGFITAINLLRYIIRSANGGYDKIYIPYVYGSSEVN